MTNFQLCFEITSLRGKRFRLVSEQKKTRNGIFGFDHARNEMRTIFRMVFDSCSVFFTPKPHKNACYAGYEIISLSLRACLRKQPKFHSNLETGFPQKSCLRYDWWPVTTQIWAVPLTGWSKFLAWPLTISTQIWVVEHHQDGMSSRDCTVLFLVFDAFWFSKTEYES